MQLLGHNMEKEIFEVPSVFERIAANSGVFSFITDLSEFTNIVILARGTSRNAGQYLKYLIEVKMGIPVSIANPSVVSIYDGKLKFSQTLVIALSQSGASPDLVKYAKSAKTGGAQIITISNTPSSPLTELADFQIPLNAGPEIAVAATKSYSAELLTSYLLVMHLLKKNFNLSKLVKEIKLLFNLQVDLKKMALDIDAKKPLIVLGRGFAFANTLELALKIQETSKVPVQAFSIADYLHGPISSLTSDTQVIFVQPKLAPVIMFNDIRNRVLSHTKKVFILNGSDLAEEESVIADSVLIQLLSLEFARKLDLDPDKPEGLIKVTLTN